MPRLWWPSCPHLHVHYVHHLSSQDGLASRASTPSKGTLANQRRRCPHGRLFSCEVPTGTHVVKRGVIVTLFSLTSSGPRESKGDEGLVIGGVTNCTQKLGDSKLTFKGKNTQIGPIRSEPEKKMLSVMMESKFPKNLATDPVAE